MEHESIENELLQFAKDELTTTRYDQADKNFQTEQLNKLIGKFRELEINYESADFNFQEMRLVPEANSTEMANIGTSASQCLALLEGKEIDQENDTQLFQLIESYLDELIDQVKQEIVGRNNSTGESEEKMIIEALNEHVEEFKIFFNQLECAQVLDAQAKESANRAKGILGQAKRLLKDATDRLKEDEENAQKCAKAAETAKKQAQNAEKFASSANKRAQSAAKAADEVIPTMLTVLGIFVGVIVAVVACYLTILLTENNHEKISSISIPLGFLFAWMMGHILVMAISSLLYMISRLVDRTLACHCRYFQAAQVPKKEDSENSERKIMPECIECKRNCNSLIRLKLRFPYIFLINIVFIIGYVILGVVHIIDLYYAKWVSDIIQSNCISLIVFAFIVLVVIIGAITVTARKINKASPSDEASPSE